MTSKARMTIRFDPPNKTSPLRPAEQTRERDSAASTGQLSPPKRESSDPAAFTTWDSPYQDDIRALEEIIRTTDINKPIPFSKGADASLRSDRLPLDSGKRELSVGELISAQREEHSRTIESEEERGSNGWYEAIETKNYRENGTGPSWGRVLLSVGGAVATGILFGYIVLGLFTGESLFPGKTDPSVQLPEAGQAGKAASPAAAPAADRQDETASGSEEALPSGGNVPETALQELPAERYYLLQYGVFQGADSMKAAVGQLQDHGYASATDTEGGYRVYAAAASSKDEAERLAAAMPDIEVYIKPLDNERLKVAPGLLTSQGAELLRAGDALIGELVLISEAGLQESAPGRITEKQWTQFTKARQRWEVAAAFADKAGESIADQVAVVVEALNSATASLTDFNDRPSSQLLRGVQSQAMKALLAQHHIRQALQA